MMWSEVTPSLSAAKFTTMRWRSTGLASARMSSRATCGRPWTRARAFAPRIRNCVARGPAPQANCSRAKSGAPVFANARLAHEGERVANQVVADRHGAHELLQLADFVGREDGFDLLRLAARRAAGDFEFFVETRVRDEHFEHEAVLLRFGQRVGAFLLDRVLRGEHEKRVRHLVPDAADRDLPLLHRFEQGGLRFGRRAVDFVGEDHVRKDRAGEEAHLALAGRAILFDDVGARDVGRHQVGRELNAAECEIQRASQRADEQRFREAGHAFEQAMAAGEQGDQHLLDHVVLADDDAGELLFDLLDGGAETGDGAVVFVVHGGGFERVGRWLVG